MFFPLHAALLFVLGALFGSFFNVCIYRMPVGQAITMPRSYCYSCGTTIRWYDNVPIVSYFILRGRCRTCRAPFSIRYAIVEFLSAVLFLAIFWQYRFCWAMPTYLAFTGLLVIATFTDIDHWVILDRISVGGAAAGILLALALAFVPPVDLRSWIVAHAGPAPDNSWLTGTSRLTWWSPVVNSAFGALSGSGLLWFIGFVGSIAFRKPAMGLGDVKLLALIGAFCGWRIAVLCIFLASLFGTVYGLGAILWDRRRRAAAEAASQETEDPEKRLQEIKALLDDDSGAAKRRGWTFSAEEKVALTRILSAPPAEAVPTRHHLPFGPHLALAAWLLMLFEPQVMGWLRAYLYLDSLY
jgi:leader peptidase (prepilin peptidase)/N-methyltransferase